MIIVDKALARRLEEEGPIRVALVGAGYMARCIALQIVTVGDAALVMNAIAGFDPRDPATDIGPLSSEEIRARAAEVLEATPTTSLVDKLAEATAGMPWLVHLVMEAIGQHGSSVLSEPHRSRGLMDQLGYELDKIDSGLSDLLLALIDEQLVTARRRTNDLARIVVEPRAAILAQVGTKGI